MFDRFARSWRIAGECLRVLSEDRSLLVFPFLSGIGMAVMAVFFAAPVWVAFHAGHFDSGAFGMGHRGQFLLWLILYFASFSIATFFNTALVAVALKRMDGQPASVADGIGVALERLPSILGYCAIAATFGAILRAIEERIGFLGKIIAGVIGFSFSIATTLVVPVLAANRIGPVDAINQSIELMKRTWGENIIGNAGISMVTVFGTLLVAGLGFVLVLGAFSTGSAALGVLAIGVALLAFVTVLAISAALHAIYGAALYRYASGGSDGRYFDQSVLGSAYRVR
jgi:hypothetical protein